jgi:ribosome-binding protein aMBF1 (putative translation factor)
MPKYEAFVDDLEWEVVTWNKTPIEENKIMTQKKQEYTETIPFNKMLILARQKAQYTSNKLTQALHIKIKDYESFENGTKLPDKNVLYKINKLLNSNLKIS